MSKENSLMDIVLNELGLEWEEVFEIEGRSCEKFMFVKVKEYILKTKQKKSSNSGEWSGWLNSSLLEDLLLGKLKIKWKPEEGDWVYRVSPEYYKGYDAVNWRHKYSYSCMFKRGFIVRTEREAIEKAKAYGWNGEVEND